MSTHKAILSRILLLFISGIILFGQLSCNLEPEIIIDNGDPNTSSTGSWEISSGSNPYGINSVYTTEDNATYAFEAVVNGAYEVSLWWTNWYNRCFSVPVEIWNKTTLLDTVYVNQRTGAGQWNAIGTGKYTFDGTAKIKIIHNQGEICSTCADAVRFSSGHRELDHIEIEGPVSVHEKSGADYNCRAYYTTQSSSLVEPDTWSKDSANAEISSTGLLVTSELSTDEGCQISTSYTEDGITLTDTYDIIIYQYADPIEIIIDNDDLGTSWTGDWRFSLGEKPYGNSSFFTTDNNATFTYKAVVNGTYEVSLWWTYWEDRCEDVSIDIYNGPNLLGSVSVNQLKDGGHWHVLGRYNFSRTGMIIITHANDQETPCSTCADAVRFTEVQG